MSPSLLSRASGWMRNVLRNASNFFRPTTPVRVEKASIVEKKEPNMMWRLTVAINYVARRRYYAYRITMWGKNHDELERHSDALQQQCAHYVSKKLGFDKNDWWFDDETAVELEEIPYDKSYIGKREVVDEFLKSKEKK